MKKILFFSFITMLMLIACKDKVKHDYRLSDEELANLMLDMHYADALLADLTPEQRDSISTLYWKRMMELYDLSETEIRDEINQLENEPEKMKLILGRVKEMSDSIQ